MNFYREAAKVLDDLGTKKHGSLKSLVFGANVQRTPAQQKRLYALLSETLKNKDILEKVIESSQLLKIERKAKISQSLALVLVHDLLCSKGGIAAAAGPVKEAILRHKTRLKADYVKAQLAKKEESKDFVPRWVRVNTLKVTMSKFEDRLHALSLDPVVDLISLKGSTNGYLIDANLQNLVAFHPSYSVTATFAREYSSGEVILQDKASCIPADLLDVRLSATALDACAAPGNKTTQLAAAVGRKGQVIAVEKDSKRVMTLKTMVDKAVTAILNKDFTSLDPTDEQFRHVTHVLLDPSCSGSGLDRLDYGQPDSDLPTRLKNLSTFQIRLLKHALSFPSVQRVVYSTCSIHSEENENVVNAVLKDVTGWRVLRRGEQPQGLKDWPRRGLVEECVSEDVAEGCIRCEKGTDGTIGFFAVGFVRDREKSANGIQLEDYEDEEEWGGIQ